MRNPQLARINRTVAIAAAVVCVAMMALLGRAYFLHEMPSASIVWEMNPFEVGFTPLP